MKKLFFYFFLFIFRVLMGDNFSVNPVIFSPYESPGINDTTIISGYMNQTLPVNLNIYLQGSNNLFRTIPYSEFNYHYDNVTGRTLWNGKDNNGSFLPDGIYEIKFKTFVNKIWSKGNSYGDFREILISPVDVGIGSDGKIYILDGQRIQVFDSNRNFLFSINSPEYNQPGHWSYGCSIAVYGNKIYLMDYEEQNIKIFDTNGNYKKSFGESGSGDGKFNFLPLNNLAVDSNGRIWVVDGENSRVQVFDSEGNFLFKFGSYGTGNGQFKFSAVAGNIAIDLNGNAYVTDDGTMAGRIQIFNSSGVYQRTIKSAYEGGPTQLVGINGPIAILGSTNKICVSSFNRWKIVILNNDGTYYTQIGAASGPGRGNGEFDFFLRSIRATANNLYTVENYDNKRVQVFNTSGSFIAKIGMKEGEFLFPRGITIGPNGNIYVCDYENASIQIFNPSGLFQSQILIPYSNFTVLKPSCIAVDTDGKIYITSSGYDVSGKLLVLSSSGNILYNVLLKDSQDKNIFITGITIIGNYLYISGGYYEDVTKGKIFVFDKTGVYQNSFGSFDYFEHPLSYLSTENHLASYSGKIYALDVTGVKIYQTDGTFISSFPIENPPTSISIDSTGKIYVSNSDVVEVYNPDGWFLYEFGKANYGTEFFIESRSIVVDSNFNVYVTDSENRRIHKYSTTADIILGTATCEIDNTKPSSIITYPSHTPTNITANFHVTGTASDKNFEKYEVYRDTNLIYSGTNPVLNNILANIDISGLSKGTHTISLTVYDLAGNKNTDSITFYIDNNPPVSYVNPLNTYTNNLSFEVSWTGYDLETGVSCYNIQVKDGIDGQWIDWLSSTTQTSATFTGENGHTYYFRSRAKDNAGNWESFSDTPDTYTKVDITKPVVLKVTPINNSFVGGNPTIKIEILDPNNGTGIKTSSISVKIDDASSSFIFLDNIITIRPNFSKGIHNLEVKFSDNAGNWADTLNLTYNALNFEGSVTTLSPDINPSTSEVMIGGKVVRYYKVIDKNGIPASGVSLLIQWAGGTKSINTDASDENGVVECVIPSKELGSVNQIITCSITDAGGYSINPPLTFNVKILSRESESSFSFGSGINLEAAVGIGGKFGEKRGMSYRIINTNLQTNADDKIEVEREFEIEAGVVAKASVGGGVKNACYASADAGVYASLVLMNNNTYLFEQPYSSDEQKILRSGLLIASLLELTNLPIVSDMLNFIISEFNFLYPK
ncbi:MAG: 6-bladed beta-propeller, partial [Candidatus Ratteibacteria bacterium]